MTFESENNDFSPVAPFVLETKWWLRIDDAEPSFSF